MEPETLATIFSMIGSMALVIALFFIVIQLVKINTNIKDLGQEVKWVINKLKGIEEPKTIPIKRKRGRPPKQK